MVFGSCFRVPSYFSLVGSDFSAPLFLLEDGLGLAPFSLLFVFWFFTCFRRQVKNQNRVAYMYNKKLKINKKLQNPVWFQRLKPITSTIRASSVRFMAPINQFGPILILHRRAVRCGVIMGGFRFFSSQKSTPISSMVNLYYYFLNINF